MAWQNGVARTATAEWKRTRNRILERDGGRCHVCGQLGADEVDHVVPVAEGGTDADQNLAAIHPHPCHTRKTQEEAARGRARKSRKRPREQHPGRL